MFYESKQGPEVQHLMFITNITTNKMFYNISEFDIKQLKVLYRKYNMYFSFDVNTIYVYLINRLRLPCYRYIQKFRLKKIERKK